MTGTFRGRRLPHHGPLSAFSLVLLDDELVDYIYYYSSEEIQEVIRYDPKLDIDLDDKKWDEAKTAFLKTLVELYEKSGDLYVPLIYTSLISKSYSLRKN